MSENSTTSKEHANRSHKYKAQRNRWKDDETKFN